MSDSKAKSSVTKSSWAKSTSSGRGASERKRLENALDQALKDTFPASDPISIVQPSPVSPQEPEDREKQKAAPIP